MLNNLFQTKYILFILILFFGIFILVNILKQFGLYEGMTDNNENKDNTDVVIGDDVNLTTVYNY
jgi:hypothetical protein